MPTHNTFFPRLASFFVLLFICIVYILGLRGVVGNINPAHVTEKNIGVENPPFESSLERGRYAQLFSIVNKQVFNVDEYSEFVKPDLAWYSGHFYPAFPPGVATLAVPWYMLGSIFNLGQVFAFASTTFFSLLTSWVLYKVAQKIGLSTQASLFAVLSFALASCAFAYSVTLSAHLVSSFLIIFCFYLSLSIEKDKNNLIPFLLLWLSYSFNIFIDYPNLFILFPLMVLTILKVVSIETVDKKIRFKLPLHTISSLIALIPILFLFVTYSMHHYKKPMAFTNTFNLRAVEILGGKVSYESLTNDIFTNRKHYSERFSNFTKIQEGIHTLLSSHDRGLIFFSPIFLLSLLGLVISYQQQKQYWRIIFLCFLANLVLYAAFDDPWGGWSFGPRYIIPTLPLLALMVGQGFELLVKKGFFIKLGISLLTLYSVAISLLGALTTNKIPPRVEADSVAAADNITRNIQFLTTPKTSSFVYNLFFHQYIGILEYYAIIFSAIAVLILAVIWIHISPQRQIYESISKL